MVQTTSSTCKNEEVAAARATASDERWYFVRNGERCGPVSPAELTRLAAAGELDPTDLVWRAGLEEWYQAGCIEDLFLPSESAEEPPPVLPSPGVLDDPFTVAKSLFLKPWHHRTAFWISVSSVAFALLVTVVVVSPLDEAGKITAVLFLVCCFGGPVPLLIAYNRKPAALIVGRWTSGRQDGQPALHVEFQKEGYLVVQGDQPFLGSTERLLHARYQFTEDRIIEIGVEGMTFTERIVSVTWNPDEAKRSLVMTWEGQTRIFTGSRSNEMQQTERR